MKPKVLWLFALALLATFRAGAASLTCSADRPVVQPGGTVVLNAWVATSDPLEWTTSAGTLQTKGSSARWLLPEKIGLQRVTVKIPGSSQPADRCQLRVFVLRNSSKWRGNALKSLKNKPASARETGHALLLSGKQEPGGYGLYSYFLLGAPPSDSERERVIAGINAYLRLSPSLEALETLLDRPELNANFVPISRKAKGKLNAEWILSHYDYARARVILGKIGTGLRRGPYLVSTRQAIGPGPASIRPLLFQDLSHVPPHLVNNWYEEFLNQASQQEYWESRTVHQLALNMRTAIGVLALGLPEVRHAIDDWVAWLE